MSRTYQLLIGGQWVDGDNGTYPIINPATEQIVGEAPECSVAQAEDAAAAAQQALPGWARTPVEERTALLRKVAEVLASDTDEMVPLIISETGATAQVGSRMQVPVAIDRFVRYGAVRATDFVIPHAPYASPTTPLAAGGLIGGVVHRQPVGVVAAISPYNFPIVNIAGKIAPALAAGCTVVIKPAPQDPLAAIELTRIMHDCGFPDGVLNIVTSSAAEPAAALTASKNVDMVSFTGSTTVGTKIFEAGGATMKRLLLELGGKGGALVLPDADVGKAVAALASVWGFHSGQICTSPTRAIVHRSKYDELVSALAATAPHLKVGDPTSMDTIVGPVISEAHRARVEAFIQQGADEGATVLVDGRRPAQMDRGYYVGPTLLVDCKPGMTPVQQEIFGPVISVLTFDDEDEGIAISNGTDFGLYDYVFSENTESAYRVAKQLRSGNVGINTAQRNHDVPFGGFKMSGIGRDGGDYGLHAYTEMQSIVWPG